MGATQETQAIIEIAVAKQVQAEEPKRLAEAPSDISQAQEVQSAVIGETVERQADLERN